MEEKNYSKVPVFENGLAQPVFKFTDGKTGEKYDPATSSIVRYCVYVESDYDMDGDGKRDFVKAFIQVPRSAVEGTSVLCRCTGRRIRSYERSGKQRIPQN